MPIRFQNVASILDDKSRNQELDRYNIPRRTWMKARYVPGSSRFSASK